MGKDFTKGTYHSDRYCFLAAQAAGDFARYPYCVFHARQ